MAILKKISGFGYLAGDFFYLYSKYSILLSKNKKIIYIK